MKSSQVIMSLTAIVVLLLLQMNQGFALHDTLQMQLNVGVFPECDKCVKILKQLDAPGVFQKAFGTGGKPTPVVYDGDRQLLKVCQFCAEQILWELEQNFKKTDGSYLEKSVSIGILGDYTLVSVSGSADDNTLKNAFSTKVVVATRFKGAKTYGSGSSSALNWIGSKAPSRIPSLSIKGKCSEDKMMLFADFLESKGVTPRAMTLYTVAGPCPYTSEFIGEMANSGWKYQIAYSYENIHKWQIHMNPNMKETGKKSSSNLADYVSLALAKGSSKKPKKKSTRTLFTTQSTKSISRDKEDSKVTPLSIFSDTVSSTPVSSSLSSSSLPSNLTPRTYEERSEQQRRNDALWKSTTIFPNGYQPKSK